MPTLPPSPDESLPLLDGKYQLVRLIGEGGMGAVYEGKHTGTGRRVAVKLMSGDLVSKSRETVARFQREAIASGAIESQYIAHILDTGVDPTSGTPYMVMELLVGEDVQQAIKRVGPLPPMLALRIAAQACLGLQKAHEAGVVHRDVKPANLFCAARDGGEVTLKILDFGIAKVKMEQLSGEDENKQLTRSGALIGSPLYMSPEQALGRKTIDHRTDIWSLGVVLYEALCGITPHGHATTVGELIMFICSYPSRLVQEHARWVSPEIAAVVHKALALDPEARFASAAEMYAAIRALLPGGHAIDAAMFAAVGAEERARIALRLALPRDVRPEGAAFSVMQSALAETMPQRTTTGGVGGPSEARSDVPAAARRSPATVMAWVGAAVIGAVVVGTAAVREGGGERGTGGGAAPASAPALASAPASALAPASAPALASAPASALAPASASASPPDASAPPLRKSPAPASATKRSNLQMDAK